MTHPTQELLERLEVLMVKATPGPWEVVPYGDGDSLVIHDARGDWRVCFMATPGKAGDFEGIEANANLIAEARSALPTLISTIRELEAEVERLRGGAGAERERCLAILAGRQEVYAKKRGDALEFELSHADRGPTYDRSEAFRLAEEALDIAIAAIRGEAG